MIKIDRSLPYSVYRVRYDKRSRIFFRSGSALLLAASASATASMVFGIARSLTATEGHRTALFAALCLVLAAGGSWLLRLSERPEAASVGAVCSALVGVLSGCAGIVLMLVSAVVGIMTNAVFVYLIVAFACYGIYKGVTHYADI